MVADGAIGHWLGLFELVTPERKYVMQQGEADARGRHQYSFRFARGPDDEPVPDTPAVRAEVDARLPAFDAEFGSFFRR
jgi:hypothetical protein